jgi:hypothetical protein
LSLLRQCAGREGDGSSSDEIDAPLSRLKSADLAQTHTRPDRASECRMIFDEYNFGNYRIFAGAIEGPFGDGFIGAVVVDRVGDQRHSPDPIFQDEALCCGHRWQTGEEALKFAMRKGMEKALAARHAALNRQD